MDEVPSSQWRGCLVQADPRRLAKEVALELGQQSRGEAVLERSAVSRAIEVLQPRREGGAVDEGHHLGGGQTGTLRLL